MAKLGHGQLGPVDQAPAPRQGPGDGGELAQIDIIAANTNPNPNPQTTCSTKIAATAIAAHKPIPLAKINLLDGPKILAIRLDQFNALALKLILNSRARQERIAEQTKELEAPIDGSRVVQGPADDGAQSPLDILYRTAECGVIGLKRGGIDIHNVVIYGLDGCDRHIKVLADIVQ